jgi:anthranilate/para-aminobenzoate synthase component I
MAVGAKVPRLFFGANLKPNFNREDFEDVVRKAKEYIVAGDVIQVVLCQKFSGEISGEDFSLLEIHSPQRNRANRGVVVVCRYFPAKEKNKPPQCPLCLERSGR